MADACNQPEKGKEISSQAEKGSDESFGFGDDLELNQFDGLPYSTRYYTLLKERKKLPIWDRRSEFLKSLENNQLIIVSGSAKTGKSTQIPQWCAEFCLAGEYQHGMVVCTQTLRQQAVDLALRVADEMDVNIGHEVGYSIPLETCCSHDTILRFCTDEILLREMMSDPFLRHYGALVIDQTQERTVSTDVLLGLLQEVLLHRPGLRAVLLSAQPFSDRLLLHYGPVPHLRSEVPSSTEVVYSNSGQKESFYSALRLALEIHRTRERGHIAVFLASEQEVDCAYTILCKEGSKLSATLGELVPVILCPGHVGTFPTPAEEPSKKRRVYLSCSQSEDMFWPVDMVNFLIDTGVERRFVYNPWIRASTEVTKPISRSQAEIRKQLTTSTGKCFRLYPEETKLPAEPPPMLMECSITPTVLFLKRLEVAGLHSCHFIDRPDPEGLMQALEELDYLAALDDDGNLSEIGIIMSEFPLDPQMAKALLASCEYDCVSEVLTIAAMLAAPSCFLEPPFGMATEALQCHTKLQHPEGDHFMLINIYNTFKRCQREPYFCLERWCQDYFLCCGALHTADALRAELADILRRIELPVSEPAFGTKSNTLNIKRALLAGYFMQVARDVDGSGNYFMLTNKHMTQVHPLSCYGTKGHKLGLPEWVLYHEYTLSENRIRTISQISPQVFVEMMPQYFFYNLPPSESKEILQHILNSKESASCGRNRSEQPIGRRNGSGQPVSSEKRGDSGEGASYDRCVVQ